jgi:tetratricopeptide (TPR) repeat protein
MSQKDWYRILGFTWYAGYQCARAGAPAKDALSCIKRAAALIPDQDEVWYELGAELNRRGQASEALPALQEYLRRAPSNFDGLFEFAYALNGLDRCEESIPVLEKLWKDHPRSALVANELGFALDHVGRPAEALGVLDAGLKEASTLAGWTEESACLRRLERWDEAEKALDQAIKAGLDPRLGEQQREQIKARQKVVFEVVSSNTVTKKKP